MNHLKKIIFLFSFLPLHSCVSVNIPTSSGVKAANINFKVPEKPFVPMDSKSADKAWINEKTGNTISYQSECGAPVDPPLQQIETDTLNFLENLKINSSSSKTFNGRESLETLAQGHVDGILVKLRVITFKKNNCSYSLVYGGVSEKFNSDLNSFDQFLKGFKAP